jgi:hypothetical protein
MIYIGYPVELAEACRLLKLNFDRDNDDYEYRKDYMTRIDQYFQKYGIRFIQQDKGLCIIGIKFDEWIGSIWEKNSTCLSQSESILFSKKITCDETMILILKAKGKVEDAMKEAEINISTIYIAHMEGEEVEMHHPQPLFIHCPFDY